MIDSISKPRKKAKLYLFIICVDKLFLKKINEQLTTNHFDSIIIKESEEELRRELQFTPLPSRALGVIMADFNLVTREFPHSKNGIETLIDLGTSYPKLERILIVNPTEKSNKNIAQKMGITNVLIKNDNFFVRFDILAKSIISDLKLKHSRDELRLLLIIFGIFILLSIAVIAGISYFEN